jgi:ABC-type sugar transport system substrate-binding protein
MKNTLRLLVPIIAVAGLLAGCSTVGSSSAPSPKLTHAATAPAPGDRPTLSSDKPSKKVKIAIIAIENNPFFAQVKVGYTAVAAKVKAAGGQVDWINAGTNVTDDTVGNAINAATAQGYSAIASLMPDNGICNYIKKATAAGVIVAAYNGDATCAQKSGAVFFHGQDLYAAGVDAGKLMCKATASLASQSKPGKVGVETESFTFQALEERRLGFVAGLKKDCPWVTPVSQGVQYGSSTDVLASSTRNYMTSTPSLVGIYVTGGNPNIAAATVGTAHKADTVKVIGFDFTAENVAQIKAGSMYASVGQDPFGQSYDTIAWLYNAVVAHQLPSPKYFIPTQLVVGTKENIDSVSK